MMFQVTPSRTLWAEICWQPAWSSSPVVRSKSTNEYDAHADSGFQFKRANRSKPSALLVPRLIDCVSFRGMPVPSGLTQTVWRITVSGSSDWAVMSRLLWRL